MGVGYWYEDCLFAALEERSDEFRNSSPKARRLDVLCEALLYLAKGTIRFAVLFP
jgi:hypothetical protein